jgi:parafibromin
MAQPDALQLLRSSIAAGAPPSLTSSSDPATAESSTTDSFLDATHLYFTHPSPLCLPLETRTRFNSKNAEIEEVDVRSAWFAWLNKNTPIDAYIALATELNKQLPETRIIRTLVFVERIDLISWLEGAIDESEHIKPLDGALQDANKAAEIAAGAGVPVTAGTGAVAIQQGPDGRPLKVVDPRLLAIYKGERKMGDRNTILRGIKPTVGTCSFLQTSN